MQANKICATDIYVDTLSAPQLDKGAILWTDDTDDTFAYVSKYEWLIST